MISHIAIFTLLVFDIMPKLAFNSEEAILCFHIDSYWPVPTTSAIRSFGFQRFYNLGNLEKARKNLETRLAGNSSLFSRKLISENVYRNLQNLQKPGKPRNVATKYL